MTAETITREEIERLLSDIDQHGTRLFSPDPLIELASERANLSARLWALAPDLMRHALSEPARLASARAEGGREGIERAARCVEGGRFLHDDAPPARFAREAAAAVRRLSPAPAEAPRFERLTNERAVMPEGHAAPLDTRTTREMIADRAAEAPTTPTVEDSDGWVEWKGGECPVVGRVQARHRDGRVDSGDADLYWWHHEGICGDILAYRIVKPAEPSTPVAPDWPTRCAALEADGIAARKLVVALEAENAKLRERGDLVVAALDGPGANAKLLVTAIDGLRALLQGGPDAG